MRIVWALVAVTILGQIGWVLVPADARTAVTIATVASFALASIVHAAVTRGPRWAAAFTIISVGIGWLAEAIGVHSGWPFGSYAYTELLGPRVLDVPLVIPAAWAMMAYPCLLAAQRLASRWWTTAALGAVLFASWDLFLDPQMVGEGYWVWHHVGLTVPGIDGIPLQNFIGWLAVALVLMLALDRLPRIPADDAAPTVLLTWVYLSNVLSAAVFFGRPVAAVWGAVAMGLVIVPWWARIARSRFA